MSVVKMNDDEFKSALKSNEQVVVKFYAGWCGSCRLIAPKFNQLSEKDSIQSVAFVEIDAENNPEARKLAGVNNLPFFAGFKNGELVEGFPSSRIEAVEEMATKLI